MMCYIFIYIYILSYSYNEWKLTLHETMVFIKNEIALGVFPKLQEMGPIVKVGPRLTAYNLHRCNEVI